MELTSSPFSKKTSRFFGPLFSEELRGHLADEERKKHLMEIAALTSSYYVAPLFLAFSLADYLFFPSLLAEFFCYRVGTVLSIVFLNALIQKTRSLSGAQWLCTLFIAACALPIQLMVVRIGDAATPYYAGLILVEVGMALGFRFTRNFFFLNIAVIQVPFLALVLFWHSNGFSVLNSMFLVSIGVIGFVSYVFQELLQKREFEARTALQHTIEEREQVIKSKTEEALSLSSLAKQFSPQVVKAVREGATDLSRPAHRAEIAAIFIDIVGSTERFVRLDREDLHRVLTMFTEHTMETLLQFDITIDKFLGDGVLAFSNDPIASDDYIERAIEASLSIRDKITKFKNDYEKLWLAPFQIGIGISSGFATVGFYGKENQFKSYTAIGRPINLAARLASTCSPAQILVSNDCLEKLKKAGSGLFGQVEFNPIGSMRLRGFEDDLIKGFAIERKSEAANRKRSQTNPICPIGHGDLILDVNSRGIYTYRCNACSFELQNLEQYIQKVA